MNLILLGGAFLGVFLWNPTVLKTPVDESIKASTVQETAAQAAEDAEQPGWMTHEISVDSQTGETTEISVIGFAD